MSRYFCHEHPEVLTFETRVGRRAAGRRRRWSRRRSTQAAAVSSPTAACCAGTAASRGHGHRDVRRPRLARAGRAGRDRGHRPGGGRSGVPRDDDRAPHREPHPQRARLPAVPGALVTGAQLNDDGTARMDFDLPDADNDRLRALEPGINDLVRQDLPIRYTYVPLAEATAVHGLSAAGRWPRRPATTAPSGSSRSSASTARPAAERTWPRPRGRARYDPQDRQQGSPQPPRPDRPGERLLASRGGPQGSTQCRGAPRLRRGVTSVGGLGSHVGAPGVTRCRGAPRLRRGVTSVGGLGGHVGAPM